MWPFRRLSARRLEIRRSKAERGRAAGRWWRNRRGLVTAGVTLLLASAAAVIVNLGGVRTPFRLGQYLTRAVVSRVAFHIDDPQQTLEMRLRAKDTSPNHYVLDASLIDEIRGRLGSLLTLAKAGGDAETLTRSAASAKLVLDESAGSALLALIAEDQADVLERAIEAAIARLTQIPLADGNEAALQRPATRAVLIEPPEGRQRTITMAQMIFSRSAESIERALDDAVGPIPPALRGSVKLSLLNLLRGDDASVLAPLYRFDAERTERAAAAARDAVPTQVRRYAVNEIIAPIGPIDADALIRLRAEDAAMRVQADADGVWTRWIELGGRSLLAAVVVVGLSLYLARFQRIQQKTARDAVRHLVAAVILLSLLAASRGVIIWSELPSPVAVGAQALAAALLAIVYAPGVVFAVTAGLAMLITLAVQQNLAYFVALMLVAGVFVLGLREVRSRGRVVVVGLWAALVAAVVGVFGGAQTGQPLEVSALLAAWGAGAALLAAFVIEGMLPLIERVFGLSTGMTLLEWCDADRPLLRLLAVEAPGTYNHSLMVGALSEAAAEAVGADGLLARTGSYYHDIGKINKPEYFVENQSGGVNRHDRLSPAMSLLIIVGHVKDGIEMAREYKLPASLLPFIAEHHGTTLVEYFYHAANRQRRPDDAAVSDTEYRYPGPKPQSRETAIVMLADGVEGAVRAMSEPTPARIEAIVSEIARKRLMDGQFDECDLAFSELATIEASLVKSLCAIYHARIAYPEGDEQPGGSPARSAS